MANKEDNSSWTYST